MIDPISSDYLLRSAQQIKLDAEGMKAGSIGQTRAAEETTGAPQFKDVLSKMIGDVDQAQKNADLSIKQVATGESNSIQDVVMKMEQADVSFKLMKEVRDKLLTAYKEIMSGQA